MGRPVRMPRKSTLWMRAAMAASLALAVSACSPSFFGTLDATRGTPEYVRVPLSQDSVALDPAARYFYRYQFPGGGASGFSPDWTLTTLHLHGITVPEAWYLPNGFHEGIPVTDRTYPPEFIVGLPSDTTSIWRYHFDPFRNFDPVQVRNYEGSRLSLTGITPAD